MLTRCKALRPLVGELEAHHSLVVSQAGNFQTSVGIQHDVFVLAVVLDRHVLVNFDLFRVSLLPVEFKVHGLQIHPMIKIIKSFKEPQASQGLASLYSAVGKLATPRELAW